MWWNAIVGATEGFMSAYSTNAQVDISNRLSAGNAAAGNLVRSAANAAEASQNNLGRWVQSVNNNRALASGGSALESNVRNYYRQTDSVLMGNFSDQIREAEAEGASNAAAAFAGIGGSVVDMVNGSVALRDSMVREAATRNQEMYAGDIELRAGNIMSQMVGGLDNSLILDSLDYNVDVAQIQKGTSQLRAAIMGGIKGLGADLQAGNVKLGQDPPKFTTQVNGVATRQRSTSQYDLADQMYDQKASFGYDYKPQVDTNPYSIGGGSLTPTAPSGGMFSLGG